METDFKWLYKQAKDAATKKKLKAIEKIFDEVWNKGKIIKSKKWVKLKLGKQKICFRENSTVSSLDTFSEIFMNDNHFLLPQFGSKGDKVVLDIGANEGYYTLRIKQNNPKAKVIAVEASPIAFKVLKKNIKENNLESIEVLNCALTDKDGKISFEVVPEISAIGGADISLQDRSWLDKKRIKKIEVKSVSLATLFKKYNLDKVDLMKLDIEGSEYDVLSAGKKLLPKIRKIVVEYHSPELKKKVSNLLNKNGFKILYSDKRPNCGDMYWVRK